MTFGSTSPWTDEATELLRALVSEGFSAGQIAKEIPGTTRSGVVGKVHRMGLVLRGARGAREPRETRRRTIRKHLPADSSLALPLLELKAHHCRFPLDSGCFCGATRWNLRTSYCEYHARICEPGRKHA